MQRDKYCPYWIGNQLFGRHWVCCEEVLSFLFRSLLNNAKVLKSCCVSGPHGKPVGRACTLCHFSKLSCLIKPWTRSKTIWWVKNLERCIRFYKLKLKKTEPLGRHRQVGRIGKLGGPWHSFYLILFAAGILNRNKLWKIFVFVGRSVIFRRWYIKVVSSMGITPQQNIIITKAFPIEFGSPPDWFDCSFMRNS